MNKFKGYLINSDFDGTFSGNENGMERNIKAIEYFKSEGGYFSFNSGRDYTSMRIFYPKAFELSNAPVVMCNGVAMYDTETKTHIGCSFLDSAVARKVASIVRENYPTLQIRIVLDPKDMTDEDVSNIGDSYADYDRYWDRRTSLFESGDDTEHDVYKILLIGDGRILDTAKTQLEGIFGDTLSYSKSSDILFEICSGSGNKGNGMMRSVEYLRAKGIDIHTVVAMGDYENDIPMLKMADVAVCPSNALDCVKAVSDYVLCSCNDGLTADYIEMIDKRK